MQKCGNMAEVNNSLRRLWHAVGVLSFCSKASQTSMLRRVTSEFDHAMFRTFNIKLYRQINVILLPLKKHGRIYLLH